MNSFSSRKPKNTSGRVFIAQPFLGIHVVLKPQTFVNKSVGVIQLEARHFHGYTVQYMQVLLSSHQDCLHIFPLAQLLFQNKYMYILMEMKANWIFPKLNACVVFNLCTFLKQLQLSLAQAVFSVLAVSNLNYIAGTVMCQTADEIH